MPAKRKNAAHILPSPKADDLFPSYARGGGGFRFVTVAADGTTKPSETFPSPALAAKARQDAQRQIDGVTDVAVGEAMDEYEIFQRHDKGGRPSAVQQSRWKLESILTDGDELLAAVNVPRARALYLSVRTRAKPRSVAACEKAGGKRKHEMGEQGCLCEPYSNDWQLLSLIEARSFFRWCVGRSYLQKNPFEEVQSFGKKKHRRRQLRIDETRKWLEVAHALAAKGRQGAVAALLAITMGLRAGEIINRIVLDVDDNGTRLHVTEIESAEGELTWRPKTDGSEGIEDIPPDVQGYLAKLIAGKAPADSIWSTKHTSKWVLGWVRRICAMAGVRTMTTHDLRRTFGTASYLGGRKEAEQRATAGLRHTSFSVSGGGSYVDKNAEHQLAQSAALKVMKGGRR